MKVQLHFCGRNSAIQASARPIQSILRAMLLSSCLFNVTAAHANLVSFLEAGNPLIDLRARYEGVDDASKTFKGHAYTVRARLGYETAPLAGFSALAELDQIWDLDDSFNSTRNGRTAYPIVADPRMTALNRLQLRYASDFATQFIVGRQRIPLGDQRFIGNAGWRQHEQTFDAATIVNTALPGTTLSYSYLARVNRVYGPEQPVPATAPASAFHCDCHLFDAAYTAIPQLKLDAFGFLLALDQRSGPVAAQIATEKLSTATFGARGEYQAEVFYGVSADIVGSYAHQSNYRDNPLSFDLNYWRGEGNLSYADFSGGIGYEAMQGNGHTGFSTPLATTHLFDGWADMFLTTPANGLGNLYVRASYTATPLAELLQIAAVTATVVHRDFSTDRTGGVTRAGLGTEWDSALEFDLDKRISVLLQYADYQGSGLAYGGFKNKSIAWVQLGYRY